MANANVRTYLASLRSRCDRASNGWALLVLNATLGLLLPTSTAFCQDASVGQEPGLKPAVPSSATEGNAPVVDAAPASNTAAATESVSADQHASEWRPLLNEKLDGWIAFTGVPHKSVTIEGFPQSDSMDSRSGKPFGMGDPKNVYSVKMIDGQPVLHVTGEVYAGLSTKEQFGDYHFSTEFKWGKKKWPPREKQKMDSGILIHCTGKQGAFWNVWMRCLECQVQEGDCGDFIQLAGTSCQVRATPETVEKPFPEHSADGQWCTLGPGVGKWGAKHFGDHETKDGWTKIEIYAVADRAVFVVNGHGVMHLKDTKVGKFASGKALTKGHIQIQSEGAELTYRDMKIRSIDSLPASFASHFED